MKSSEARPQRYQKVSPQIPPWRDERAIRAVAQVISSVLIVGLVISFAVNLLKAADRRGLRLGFDFLNQTAGFPIGETIIPYDPSQTFGYAFLAGVLNTIKAAAVGIVLASLLGTLVGLARLSSNWLVSRLALVYIELHRNIPLLVLLFLWYFSVFTRMPPVKEAIHWPGPVYLSQRGLYTVWGKLTASGSIWVISVLLGATLATVAFIALRRRREATGKPTHFVAVALVLLIGIPSAGWILAGGRPIEPTVPVLQGFNFRGGLHLTPEFAALLVALVMYTAAFIAEAVRSGIQAVSRGQLEAARAIGLNHAQILGLVVLPQALRAIIPPLISQYLNLTKNSSLALAIGYPELFTVGRIMINQAGRAVPVFAMIMVSYLMMSLFTSVVLNLYNRRVQFVER